ncbi:hypothetical protein [uncultured Intestinimonas sp.]|uniref:hypothetical protein n=1 Tax=uncultured Intestinimonas sp. TaxID=1689265 RepID=UPI0025D3CE2D|nr:hypothetical protein [uncultured Intestinimonas sp.]
MREQKQRYDAEFAGALAPELEGAPHSRAHARRQPPPTQEREERGETSSRKSDSPQGPSRP